MRLENLQFEFDVDEQDALTHPIELSKEEFIAAIISSAVEDDFDQSQIRKMCDSQQWDQTVVFRCHGIIGGIGASYSFFLTFLKLILFRKYKTRTTSLHKICDRCGSWTLASKHQPQICERFEQS